MMFESATLTAGICLPVPSKAFEDSVYIHTHIMQGFELTSAIWCKLSSSSLHQFNFSLLVLSTVFSLPEAKMLSFFGLVPHGSILDIPNGYLGIAFYALSLTRHVTGIQRSGLLSHLFHPTVNLIITTLAFSSSIFLARKLYIIQEVCVVCITTHIINTTIFYRSIQEALSVSEGKIKRQ